MLNDMLGAFGEGHTTVVSAEQGILLLEGWINALQGDIGAERILDELRQLRDQIKSDHCDNDKVRHLLLSLASHTSAISHEPRVDPATADQLKQLVNILRNFSSQL